MNRLNWSEVVKLKILELRVHLKEAQKPYSNISVADCSLNPNSARVAGSSSTTTSVISTLSCTCAITIITTMQSLAAPALQLLGTLRYATARFYYGYFGREGLG